MELVNDEEDVADGVESVRNVLSSFELSACEDWKQDVGNLEGEKGKNPLKCTKAQLSWIIPLILTGQYLFLVNYIAGVLEDL